MGMRRTAAIESGSGRGGFELIAVLLSYSNRRGFPRRLNEISHLLGVNCNQWAYLLVRLSVGNRPVADKRRVLGLAAHVFKGQDNSHKRFF